jgi:serine/threonine-protein kinase
VGDSDTGDDNPGTPARPSQRLASVAEVELDRARTDVEELFGFDERTPIKDEPAASTDLPEGTKIGEYEVTGKIGEGAMGTVYKATHPAIGKVVAIKVISPRVFAEPDAVKRFVAEARAVAAIGHPGIVHVFGFGRLTDSRTYLTMEWLDGESLGTRLREKGRLPMTESLDIVRQIARALDAAHAKDIVHRDLKPDNVFLQRVEGEAPIVKLLDFGLAKVVKRDDMLVARTRTGQILGTPLYMSPEQCRAKGVDHRTDIYALGCMCYELFVGRVPFDHDNAAELISAHLVQEPPKPRTIDPSVPRDLDSLLPELIAKEPEKRPTLSDLRRVLATVSGRLSQPISVVPREPITNVLPAYVRSPMAGAVPEADDVEAGATVVDLSGAKPARGAPIPWTLIAIAVVVGGGLVAALFALLSRGSHQPQQQPPAPPPAAIVAPDAMPMKAPVAIDAAVAPADAEIADAPAKPAVKKPDAPADAPPAPQTPPRQGSEAWTPDSPFLPK